MEQTLSLIEFDETYLSQHRTRTPQGTFPAPQRFKFVALNVELDKVWLRNFSRADDVVEPFHRHRHEPLMQQSVLAGALLCHREKAGRVRAIKNLHGQICWGCP